MRDKSLMGIYSIVNKINNRTYVGLSTDILSRWRQHLRMLVSGQHHSFELQSDFDELGIKHFSFNILELCEEEQLREREIYWISKLNAETEGYNMTDKAYKPPALLVAENDQLKAENKELKNEIQKLTNEMQKLIIDIEKMKAKNGELRQEVDELYKGAEEEWKHQKKQSEDELLLEQAKELVVETRTASVSLLQRYFRIGYTRAARLIDNLERMGVIGPYNGSAPREVLIDRTQLKEKSGEEDCLTWGGENDAV